MSNNRRFAVDEKRYVIDAVNPANSGRATGDPKTIPKTTGSARTRTYNPS